LQETLFNAVAALLYASSSGYLSYAVNIFLRPLYVVTPFFQVYPAMTAAYVSEGSASTPGFLQKIKFQERERERKRTCRLSGATSTATCTNSLTLISVLPPPHPVLTAPHPC
jgi:hypothetical protein